MNKIQGRNARRTSGKLAGDVAGFDGFSTKDRSSQEENHWLTGRFCCEKPFPKVPSPQPRSIGCPQGEPRRWAEIIDEIS